MSQIILLFSLYILINVNAKLRDVPDFDYLENYNYELSSETIDKLKGQLLAKKGDDLQENVWLLSLEMLGIGDLKLRAASKDEVGDFNKKVQPLIDGYENDYGPAKKPTENKSEPYEITPEEEVKVLKANIMKIVNKFVSTALKDPDSEISEYEIENSEPLLAFYFKGAYTCLILRHELSEWHFFIAPPSLLPHWFYESHTSDYMAESTRYVNVPKYVEYDFYRAVMQLLLKFLSMAI